jgi:thiamine pyrophosphate-dependent acetolactate synthase large subunit-like protein
VRSLPEDLALLQACGGELPRSKIVQCSMDQYIHHGWNADYQALPPADAYLMCEADAVVPLLLKRISALPASASGKKTESAETKTRKAEGKAISIRALADAFNEASARIEVCLTQLPLGWNGAYRHFRHPLDYLGANGGGGVGAGPGLTVGAALALKGTGRVVVGILGDGDFLMGATALWTAAHFRVPCLFLIANNRSFYNDELHQERVAKERSRPVENKWIGQRLADPEIDLAAMARSHGALGFGPVADAAALPALLAEAVAAVAAGAVAVVDVRVEPGYTPAMAGALTREAKP